MARAHPVRSRLSRWATLIPGLLLATTLLAQDPVDREQAEQQLAELGRQISALQESIEASRSEYRAEQDQLRELDLEIDSTARQTHELESRQETHRQELNALEGEKEELLEDLLKQQDQLGDILRSAYRLDRHSRLKLVLNQDNPAQLNRMLAYYEYFNSHQVEDIAELKNAVQKLEQVQQRINAAIAGLETTRQELDQTMQMLDGQREG